MSSHPGSTLHDAIALALYLKRENLSPEQVQDFYPTPGTASTVMFATGIDPFTGKKVYVARDPREKRLQRALLQYGKPENAPLVREALIAAHREDLIGTGKDCLVRPENTFKPQGKNQGRNQNQRNQKNSRPQKNAKGSKPAGNGRKNVKKRS
jgi:hypothetical protein